MTTISRKSVRVLVFVVVIALTSGCPPDWKEWNGSCYILLSRKMNWHEGVNACNQYGVNMIVPNSRNEYEYLWDEMTKWMEREGATIESDLQLWIGCRDVGNTKNMRCQGDQDNSVYPNWYGDEPNEPNECIRMTGSYNGQLGDKDCGNTYFVACEMKVVVPSCRPRAPSSARYTHVPGLCLLNHQIKSYPVKQPIGCGLACWAEPRCHSYSLSKKLDEIICQVNNATRLEADVTDIKFVEKCYFYEP